MHGHAWAISPLHCGAIVSVALACCSVACRRSVDWPCGSSSSSSPLSCSLLATCTLSIAEAFCPPPPLVIFSKRNPGLDHMICSEVIYDSDAIFSRLNCNHDLYRIVLHNNPYKTCTHRCTVRLAPSVPCTLAISPSPQTKPWRNIISVQALTQMQAHIQKKNPGSPHHNRHNGRRRSPTGSPGGRRSQW